jgi:hypothetical protein
MNLIRPLTIHDVLKDYEAVMSSIGHLRRMFGEQWNWPSPNLSIEQNFIDLGWHQKEFQTRSSFAYTIMTVDESKCLGCVYVYPSKIAQKVLEVHFWVRESEYLRGFDDHVFKVLQDWFHSEWLSFEVIYPDRELKRIII